MSIFKGPGYGVTRFNVFCLFILSHSSQRKSLRPRKVKSPSKCSSVITPPSGASCCLSRNSHGQETWVRFMGGKDPLRRKRQPNSQYFCLENLRQNSSGRLQKAKRVPHDSATEHQQTKERVSRGWEALQREGRKHFGDSSGKFTTYL